MRGGLQYEKALDLTLIERQRIAKFIERRMEDESKSLYPVY